MRRREFLAGSLSLAGMTAAKAQGRKHKIGWLSGGSPIELFLQWKRAFEEGVSISGIEFEVVDAWARGSYNKLSELGQELVQAGVEVVVCTPDTNSTKAMMSVSKAVPIVMAIGADPVEAGIIRNANRPDGNVTGISFFTNQLGPKRMDLLLEVIPTAKKIGFIHNPNNVSFQADQTRLLEAAKARNVELITFKAASAQEIDESFNAARRSGVDCMLVGTDALYLSQMKPLAEAARSAMMFSFCPIREYVEAGCGASYGDSRGRTFQQAGVYTGRILHGEKPQDLPIQYPQEFEFILNQKEANRIGINIPLSVLARADSILQ